MAAARIAGLLRGDKAQREAAYAELSIIADGGEAHVETMVDCVRPLVEAVFAADVSDVDAQEYRRAHNILMELFFAQPLAVQVAHKRGGLWGADYQSPGNAYAAAYERELSQLNRSDALVIASQASENTGFMCLGMDKCCSAFGGTVLDDWLPIFIGGNRCMMPDGKHERASGAYLEKLSALWLDIVREPRDVPRVEVAGALQCLIWCIGGKPAIMRLVVEGGLLEILVAELQKSSPVDWVQLETPCTADNLVHGCCFAVGWSFSTLVGEQLPGGVNMTQLLLDSGFIGIIMSALKAYELRGANNATECNVFTVWGAVCCLASLDLTAADAKPITHMLSSMQSTLSFIIQHDVLHISQIGFQAAAHTCVVCACAFGKDEGELFEFTTNDIASALENLASIFSGIMAQWTPKLQNYFLRPILQLCISDKNKRLLLDCGSTLISLLTEVLLLDPDHPRQSEEQRVKVALQQDAVECLLQLAVFEDGRTMLAQQSLTMDAIRALANGAQAALSSEAQTSASAALVAVEGHRPTQPATPASDCEAGDLHIMLSYQWVSGAPPVLFHVALLFCAASLTLR